MEMEIYTLSSLINKHQEFGKCAQLAYTVTDYICQDYPQHFEWYWAKQIPRVLDGTGEVVICTINNDLAGVAFLKKDDIESKICTFLVLERFRGKHVATKMLERAFEWLNTTKPLITIADYKIPMFETIIGKYNWELTQIMSKGYYNNYAREFVYNGKLPE